MIKQIFTRREDIPDDAVQRRGLLCGFAMIFTWAFMGFFQEDFPCYAPFILTIMTAVSVHDMGFEFVIIPTTLVLLHGAVLIYCYTSVQSVDHHIFRSIGLAWGLIPFVFQFLYMFIYTTILDVRPVELKTPDTNV